MNVYLRKEGRITLPSEVRKKYKIGENSKLDLVAMEDKIILIPIIKHKNPSKELFGILKIEHDDPKKIARNHMRKKLKNEIR